MNTYFITGIGTGIGKTLAAAVLCKAIGAAYWKPVQAGFDEGTDSGEMAKLTGNSLRIFPETYKLEMPASPHIAARSEKRRIAIPVIVEAFRKIRSEYAGPLVIEGAGGLMVPLNEREFMTDLALALEARVVLVSRNYLGSINHSLLTAAQCGNVGLNVAGWIFNDQYLDYEAEITAWSGYPSLFSLPRLGRVDPESVTREADRVRAALSGLA